MDLATTTARAPSKTFASRLRKDLIMNKYVYIMACPIIVFYILFHYVPMAGLVIAFQDFNAFKGILGSHWVGLKHINEFLTSPYAFRVIKNTFLLNVYQILFGFPAPILLALLLNEIRSHIFKRTVQTVSYMPHFISLVVVCGMLVDFTASSGVINDLVHALGGERTNLLMQKEWFRTIFISSGIWQEVGWGSIIYLAALSSVDPSLYEAAEMDGASRLRKAMHITLPALVPTITILLIMRLGHIMSEGFEKIILLYNPLTYETADVIASYVYRRGLQEANYSFGAAVGLFNSSINFIILLAANYVSRRFVKESLW
ncbi:putative multiple-sugar transport system permease YteP [Paenibacillus konkukensis]|uniref:Multiple-sugar transport system permease YteP n=1 Tax=Paenibacillus konkukensis TaxID=2020716 RepID=A0ABY4RJP4_9BACL|nr:ABC transporter permease subunit [Paenibacillus konkukensis]UQZ82442.1 putative multiple-sugar transport system permease YteP [Paenibacillus konkukensis]